MTQWLKQSTAVTVKVGPFVDSADGTTAETALTIQKADVRLSKNGGNYAAANADQGASDAGAAHDELGDYDISLDATDTNTLGRLRVIIKKAGALVVWADFMVAPANVWDSLFGADNLQVDVTQVGGSAQDIATATALATVDGNVDAIKAKTDNLPSDPADASVVAAATDAILSALATVDGNVDSILEDTGTTIPASIADLPTAAENATAVLTTQMTESYAADGAAPTLAQALFQLTQYNQDRAISGTEMKVKKLDGTTDAMTIDLDDATTPTAVSRSA